MNIIELALQITAELKQDFPKAKIVVTGPLGPHNLGNVKYFEKLKKLREELNLKDSAHFLAELTDEFIPDAVISDSKIWEGAWAEGRAKAYGVKVEELPAYYAKRTLLNEMILPEDIANACFAFVGGLLNKSTGNALNVDGGVAMGFYR